MKNQSVKKRRSQRKSNIKGISALKMKYVFWANTYLNPALYLLCKFQKVEKKVAKCIVDNWTSITLEATSF
jgi:hypothetical protein